MTKKFTKSFKLGKKGLGCALGDLEMMIMDTLWKGREAAGKEIFDELSRSRDQIALTTALTVLGRLVKKGLVSKEKGAATYLYKPTCSREEFTRNISHEVLKGVIEISTSSAAASFVEILADTDLMELDRLELLIDKKREEMKILNDQVFRLKAIC
jgi:predicted transcriptional regulator